MGGVVSIWLWSGFYVVLTPWPVAFVYRSYTGYMGLDGSDAPRGEGRAERGARRAGERGGRARGKRAGACRRRPGASMSFPEASWSFLSLPEPS